MSKSSQKSRKKGGVSLTSLQHIENIFGSIVCGLLHLPAQFIPKPKNMDPAAVKRVLVIKFFGIGSLVLAEPFFRKARTVFPNAQIDVLTLSSNRHIMDMIDGVDRVQYVDLGRGIVSAIAAYIGVLVRVFREKYDVVLDMEFYTRASAVVSLAAWAPVRIGYHAQGIYRGSIQSHRVAFNRYWHVTQNFLSLLAPYGGCVTGEDRPVPKINLPETPSNALQGAWDSIGGAHTPYVAINVNAGELAYERRWFPDRFAALAAWFHEKYSLQCLFIGAPAERDYVQDVVDRARALGAVAINTAGDLDLASTALLCAQARLVISNDSGPLHVAAASGARVVGFFGPETPVLYGPAGEGHLVFHKSISCSPCINAEHGKRINCPYPVPKCQEEINVDDVCNAVETHYDKVLRV